MLRKFGFKKSEPRESEARLRLQKELFAYNKCTDHGFPHKPSSLAYDPTLKLMAIGTRSGAVRIYGQPGVEFSAQHNGDAPIKHLFFLKGEGRLISFCDDNSLHLWELNEHDGRQVLEEVKEFSMEASKLKNISVCCIAKDNEVAYLGTEGGNIHILNTRTFTLDENVLFQDVVMQNAPDDFKVNPGAVEAISQSPTNPDKFLIGYNRGLIVMWDMKDSNADQTYNATQQLESVSWHRDGTQFMSAHSDGSYIIWSSTDATKPKEQATTPYGPFPCKSITKVQWKSTKTDPFIVFAGGMPRASYGDRHTLSIMQGANHTVLDFTSRVIDFVVVCKADQLDCPDKAEYDDPDSIVVLVEEELVAVDLDSAGWPLYRQPYLSSMHVSAITCATHATNVPDALWDKINDAGQAQMESLSSRTWPIIGGKENTHTLGRKDLLLTGHEDGSVRFWDSSTTSVRLLYKVSTAPIFDGEGHSLADADEEWPPFRKAGTFDPYSDDPRLAIQKLSLCPLSETLVLGGTAGQVIVMSLSRDQQQHEVAGVAVNVVSDRDNFVWKGHEALTVKGGEQTFPAGFQTSCVMQLSPPAACTALTLHSEWQLVAAGTAHGFAVFDFCQKKEVTTKCTLNPNDLTGTGESAMSRHKSFKKSLRESFRRLRKRRSERRKKPEETKSDEAKSGEGKSEGIEAGPSSGSPAKESAGAAANTPPETPTKPVERQVEAREKAPDDQMGSMVRSLYFTDTFLVSAQNHTPTLWAGTNAGGIFVFQITLPSNEKRDSDRVQCVLGKEIQLKHRAPVIAINVIDRNAYPLPGAFEVAHEQAKNPDMSGSHQVVICSEEQFKIFSLPSLKALHKYKLTAHEGSKVRKTGFINFRSRSDEKYSENDLGVLTNQGDLQVFTVPYLRRQLKADCIRKENVTGVASFVFASNGEGFFLSCPSEFVRISLSARTVTRSNCEVELPEGIRPIREPEPEAETSPEAEPAAQQPAEESSASKTQILESHASSRTVVTRTVVSEVTEGGQTTVTKETTVVTSGSDDAGGPSDSAAGDAAAAPSTDA
eukprot:GHVU01023088.1.p1 GENE.GHVU01023088.1~~GHVU01023088.1.p1  ORF type:complete len:1053 (-),score=140.01 GHVU01023088.1:1527-4685(-)